MEIYCSQLGMVVDFSYCTSMNEGLPCRNIIGCCQGRMDVYQFLKKRFTETDLKKVFYGLPKSRMERMIEAVNTKIKPENGKID